jgi:hypothetical protein
VALTLFFKLFFLTRTTKEADQWWMPAVSPQLLAEVTGKIFGWDGISRFASAAGRHVPGAEAVLLVGAAVGFGLVAWAAWGHRGAAAARPFLAMSAIYWGLLIAYSLIAVPLVWPRIMLPGMIPLCLAVQFGLDAQPRRWLRRSAQSAIALFAFAIAVPWLHGLAYQSPENLRGFVATLRENWRPAAGLIMVGGVEWGVLPYWRDYSSARPVLLDIRDTPPATLGKLAESLKEIDRQQPILLVYREDFYLAPRHSTLDQVEQSIAATRPVRRELWNQDYYHILRFEAAATP